MMVHYKCKNHSLIKMEEWMFNGRKYVQISGIGSKWWKIFKKMKGLKFQKMKLECWNLGEFKILIHFV